ncbi:MAG TPA: WxL domain-containing protein [Mycobacteriales bacterium]|nr:WxL domain-containing protein [Mycobacteriales bacterium]
MRTRHRLAVFVAVLAGGLGAALPASASTAITFTVSAGTLSISEPASAALGSVTSSALGTTVSGALGTTTITDNRGSTAGWTLSFAASNFTDAASDSIAASQAAAWLASPAVVTSGIAVVTNTHIAAATALTLGTSAAAFMTATTTGSNVVTYAPTVQVTIASDVVPGSYSGTTTQTVA